MFKLQLYQLINFILVTALYGVLMLLTYKRAHYTKVLLAALVIWAILHLAGTAVIINNQPLYSAIILPVSETWPIVRFDQLVHIFGFGAATLLMYQLLASKLQAINRYELGFIVVMAGLGLGALNEVFEFIIGQAIDGTNVGDYLNTGLDLIADIMGAILALPLVFKLEQRRKVAAKL